MIGAYQGELEVLEWKWKLEWKLECRVGNLEDYDFYAQLFLELLMRKNPFMFSKDLSRRCEYFI